MMKHYAGSKPATLRTSMGSTRLRRLAPRAREPRLQVRRSGSGLLLTYRDRDPYGGRRESAIALVRGGGAHAICRRYSPSTRWQEMLPPKTGAPANEVPPTAALDQPGERLHKRRFDHNDGQSTRGCNHEVPDVMSKSQFYTFTKGRRRSSQSKNPKVPITRVPAIQGAIRFIGLSPFYKRNFQRSSVQLHRPVGRLVQG